MDFDDIVKVRLMSKLQLLPGPPLLLASPAINMS